MTFLNKQEINSQLSTVLSPNVPPTIIWGNEILRPVCVINSNNVTILPNDSNKSILSATNDSLRRNSLSTPKHCIVGKPGMTQTMHTVNTTAQTLLMPGSVQPNTFILTANSNKTVLQTNANSNQSTGFTLTINNRGGRAELPQRWHVVNTPAPTVMMPVLTPAKAPATTLLIPGSLPPRRINAPAETPGMLHDLQTVHAVETPTLKPGLTQVFAPEKTWLTPTTANVPAKSNFNWIGGKPEININLQMTNVPSTTAMLESLGYSQRQLPMMPGTGPSSSTMGNRSSSSGIRTLHEHFKYWQKYNTLVRRNVPCFPDTEALSCFMIPVLRSLTRLRPDMKVMEGVRYTVKEWLKTSEADRKIFYEMAKKFIEFEQDEAKQKEASIQRQAEGRKTYDINMETEGSLEAGIHEEITPMTETAVQVDIYDEQAKNKVQSVMEIEINEHSESPVQDSISKKSTVHTNRRVRADPLLLPADKWNIKHNRSHLCYERQKKWLKRHLYRQHRKIAPGYMETLNWPRSVKLPKRVEGRSSEDSPEAELLHYIETLCDQPEFLSQVEEIIKPAFLDAILSADREIDIQALNDELEREENILPLEVEEIIKPAFLDAILSADREIDIQALNDELEREENILPLEVEDIIKPSLLDGMLFPERDIDFQTLNKELKRDKNLFPFQDEEIIKSAFLDTDLFLDTDEDFRTLNYELEREQNLLPSEFIEITENRSTSNKPIVLPEEKDESSSKFTSKSHKANQHSQMTLNTNSGHPKRPYTNLATVKLKSNKITSNTADSKRQPFYKIKEELKTRPLKPLRQSKKQKTETTAMRQTATTLPAFGDRESTAHKADPWLIEGQMSYTRGTSVGPQNTLPILMNVTDVTMIPHMKILEMTNYTAGTRKTKALPKLTKSRDYTYNNDDIVIDDEDSTCNNDVIVLDED